MFPNPAGRASALMPRMDSATTGMLDAWQDIAKIGSQKLNIEARVELS
jgi:hypothetical protein